MLYTYIIHVDMVLVLQLRDRELARTICTVVLHAGGPSGAKGEIHTQVMQISVLELD